MGWQLSRQLDGCLSYNWRGRGLGRRRCLFPCWLVGLLNGLLNGRLDWRLCLR